MALLAVDQKLMNSSSERSSLLGSHNVSILTMSTSLSISTTCTPPHAHCFYLIED